MTDKKDDALKLALEALTQIADAMPFPVGTRAIAAIREALEQRPIPNLDDPNVQAVYAILCDDVQPPEGHHWEGFVAQRIVDEVFRVTPHRPHPNEVDIEALEQPQQEPFYWYDEESGLLYSADDRPDEAVPLCTAPPRREWVGLTEEDIRQCFDVAFDSVPYVDFARAIEAHLKEKNCD